MPPPPVTPSPHRFVIKKERAGPIRRPLPPPEDQTPRPPPSTQQFNATPRFTFSSTPRPTPSQNLQRATPAPSRYLTPGAKKAKKELDAIDISSDDYPDDVHDSIEVDQQDGDVDVGYTSADLEDDGIEERSPKRRRLSSALGIEEDERLDEHEEQDLGDNLSSSLPILSSPPAPRRPVSTTAPRFLLSTPAPLSTPHPTSATANTHIFLKPPRFRPPDPSTQAEAQGDPLPEQFSPHRKGQKYVPGGLAAEMRDMLVNIESSIPAQGQAQGEKRKDEPWLVKVVVDEVCGNERAGMTLVRGRKVPLMDEEWEMADMIGIMKIALAGEGAGIGLQRGSKVEAGRTVGIKGPVWEVVIQSEKWGVGVDWKVL